jgi:hypothetical protein
MKRSIFVTAIALMISAGITAQVTTQQQSQAQRQEKQTQVRVRDQEKLKDGSGPQAKLSKEEKKMMKEQRKAQKRAQKKANHGRMVSETARSTESGPGKGEVVSTQARTQGQSTNKGARGNSGRNRGVSPAKSGAGRK